MFVNPYVENRGKKHSFAEAILHVLHKNWPSAEYEGDLYSEAGFERGCEDNEAMFDITIDELTRVGAVIEHREGSRYRYTIAADERRHRDILAAIRGLARL